MLEAKFNSIVTSSINSQGGFAFKIPDERSTITGYHSKNPYDIYGLYGGMFVCWESKSLNKPESFNLNRLEQHQIDNLIGNYELIDNCLAVFAICIDFGHADKRVFIFKNDGLYHIRERKENKENIFKKEFEQRKNYIKIKKGIVDMEELIALPQDICR